MLDTPQSNMAAVARQAFVSRVRRTSLAVLCVALVVSLIAFSDEVTLGIGLGGLLAILNFQGLCVLIGRLLGGGGRSKVFFFFVFMAKFVLLMVAIYLVVKYVPMDLMSFMAGVSVLFAVLMLESYRKMVGQTRDMECNCNQS